MAIIGGSCKTRAPHKIALLAPFLAVPPRLLVQVWSRRYGRASKLALRTGAKIIDFLGYGSFATTSMLFSFFCGAAAAA